MIVTSATAQIGPCAFCVCACAAGGVAPAADGRIRSLARSRFLTLRALPRDFVRPRRSCRRSSRRPARRRPAPSPCRRLEPGEHLVHGGSAARRLTREGEEARYRAWGRRDRDGGELERSTGKASAPRRNPRRVTAAVHQAAVVEAVPAPYMWAISCTPSSPPARGARPGRRPRRCGSGGSEDAGAAAAVAGRREPTSEDVVVANVKVGHETEHAEAAETIAPPLLRLVAAAERVRLDRGEIAAHSWPCGRRAVPRADVAPADVLAEDLRAPPRLVDAREDRRVQLDRRAVVVA